MKTKVFAILMLILLISNVYMVSASSGNLDDVEIRVYSNKSIFPYFVPIEFEENYTITLTNIGSEVIEDLWLDVTETQVFPSGRVPWEWWLLVFNITLNPGETKTYYFETDLDIMHHWMWFGLFSTQYRIHLDTEHKDLYDSVCKYESRHPFYLIVQFLTLLIKLFEIY